MRSLIVVVLSLAPLASLGSSSDKVDPEPADACAKNVFSGSGADPRIKGEFTGSDGMKLILPTIALKESYLKALREFQAEGLHWYAHINHEELEHNFQKYVCRVLSKKTDTTKWVVPETVLWAVCDSQFAGRIAIRHRLTVDLRIVGGHIGYDVAPSFRRRGVATEMLAQVLPVAREIGLKKVLLTCDDTNEASIKVIEKNGGVLREKKSVEAGKPLKRYYWITL